MSNAASPAATVALAGYLALSLGLLYGLAIAQRRLNAGEGAERVVAGAALLAGLAFAGIMLLNRTGHPGFGVAGVLSFALFLLALVEIGRRGRERRLPAGAAIVLVVAGTLILKALEAFRAV